MSEAKASEQPENLELKNKRNNSFHDLATRQI